MFDLTNDEQLKLAIAAIDPFKRSPDWLRSLEHSIAYVQEADEAERSSEAFHQHIWEENPVSDVGMGTVNVRGAIENESFRRWFASRSLQVQKRVEEDGTVAISDFYEELTKEILAFSGRRPLLKIMRVLALLFPRHFTTIADLGKALAFHRVMFGKLKKPGAVKRHWDVRQRIDGLIGETDSSPKALARRMTYAWILYENNVLAESADEEVSESVTSGTLKLHPLPAAQRRKGLTAIGGGVGAISSALSFVENEVTREELIDHLRSEFPDYKENSLRVIINVLKNEFHVVEEKGGILKPTSRGVSFLENEDPQELIPLLLTRVLGVDHVIKALEHGPLRWMDLIEQLKQVNSGWTTNYAPGVILKWLRDFDLLSITDDRSLALTESGQSWVKVIDWEPEKLRVEQEFEEKLDTGITGLDIHKLDQADLLARVIGDTAISSSQVRQLHLGLWSHKQRHFAIMAGLSGSGKTFLAQRYAKALAQDFTSTPEKNVYILPVQPGWYDPSPLFGYVNPLMADSYVRPPLLDFFLRASRNPDQPFTVILDEMNLSHPEQYFAPVLSAMESGDHLRLHNEGDVFDGVPAQITYPSNMAFIGTVNMDETTHGISDKVLDRAYTLEFWQINLDEYPNWNAFNLSETDVSRAKECLGSLMTVLSPERMHFGWRTVEDVLSYLELAARHREFDLVSELDNVIYARILPKLRGSESQRLQSTLDALVTELARLGLRRCCDKVRSLQRDLMDTGMMRFWR
ncbi:hypothetical protein PVT68_16100 [Microbulbifer bruguierae]|uniref:PH domain-containing protein n=1 Tax=Microbulbifer bruguierae TaxID=3029061 RepID=A0ABY8NEU8_9GAMM|nr:hypothetical protein [Microbulbifer bruguierae]WGL16277.1 hypothetical protein PVT68_16100 [Microbulbifer bruguierae]